MYNELDLKISSLYLIKIDTILIETCEKILTHKSEIDIKNTV